MNQPRVLYTAPRPNGFRGTVLAAGFALAGTFALSPMAVGQAMPAPGSPVPPASSSAVPAKASAAGQSGTSSKTDQGIDLLIKHLHNKLKITAAQETLWQNVAAVMRENADTLAKMAKDRATSANTMTAVDDLKSYSDISQARADAAKKLVAPFQSLYDSMSETQKKAADIEFREHYRHHHHMS